MDVTHDEEVALYTAVGAIIINWGITESTTSHACQILIEAGGHKSYRLPPREMGRKLRFLKNCFKAYPELRHMRDRLANLQSNTKVLATERDKLVHGAWHKFDRENHVFGFAQINAGKREYTIEGWNFPLINLLKLSEAAIEISADWIKLLESLYAIRDSEKGLKQADRVWYVAISIWADDIYQSIKRGICRILGCKD